MKDYMISMFIDDELDFDEKILYEPTMQYVDQLSEEINQLRKDGMDKTKIEINELTITSIE